MKKSRNIRVSKTKRTRNAGAKFLFNPHKTPDAQNEFVKDKYGFNPESIWQITKSKQLVDYVSDTIGNGSFEQRGKGKKKGEKTLSMFNPDLIYRIIDYYTNPGDTVVAPYGSRGVIGLISFLLGRHSYSMDVVPEYVDDMKERCKQVKIKSDDKTIMEFMISDARTRIVQGITRLSNEAKVIIENKKIKENIADLLLLNPPYHKLEIYKDADGQLSNISNYDNFLEELGKAIEQHYLITKEDGFCIAVVNDFRMKNRFYTFHADVIKLCEKVGFKQHDVIINKLNSRSLQSTGSFSKLGLKIMCKVHEYVLVFVKPGKSDISYRDKWKRVENKLQGIKFTCLGCDYNIIDKNLEELSRCVMADLGILNVENDKIEFECPICEGNEFELKKITGKIKKGKK